MEGQGVRDAWSDERLGAEATGAGVDKDGRVAYVIRFG